MLFNMDVSHMAISAPGVSELLKQTVFLINSSLFSLNYNYVLLGKKHFRDYFRKDR